MSTGLTCSYSILVNIEKKITSTISKVQLPDSSLWVNNANVKCIGFVAVGFFFPVNFEVLVFRACDYIYSEFLPHDHSYIDCDFVFYSEL